MKATNDSIDRRSPIPLYFQLKEILLRQIQQSGAGILLPTEAWLCARFAISRPTVRQAIKELENQGYVYRKKGKGTFVAEKKVDQEFLLVLRSFNDEMKDKGLNPSTKILEFKIEESDAFVSQKLHTSCGETVIRLRRLRAVNGEPFVLVLTFLPHRLLPDLSLKDLVNDKLYRMIEEDYGYKIDNAARQLEARIAGEYEAKTLGIRPGAPIQYIETVTYLTDGTPIEFSQARYRGDRANFAFRLKRQHPR